MKIGQLKEMAVLFIRKDKKRALNIAIFILALVIAYVISISQGRVRKSLSLKRGVEIKKNELLNDLSQSEKIMKSYREALINEKDAPAFVNTINSIAKELNIEVISIKPEPEIGDTAYIRYPFVLTIQADNYHAIGKFIARIEGYSESNFVQMLSIKTLKESQAPDKGPQEAVQLTDKLVVGLYLNLVAFKN